MLHFFTYQDLKDKYFFFNLVALLEYFVSSDRMFVTWTVFESIYSFSLTKKPLLPQN